MVQGQNENEAPEVKVTEMSDKALKINLNLTKKGKTLDPSEEETYDDSTTSEIQVICEGQGRLHGILKQRSRSQSESSDDLQSTGSYSRENSTSSSCHMSESPISESDETEGSLEGRLKKSVSFNEHVDHATFKPGATVCSMKTSLKSKRRRSRKREEKKRRRHNSTGSEYSSSDELPHGPDTEDLDEDFDAEMPVGGEKYPTSPTKLATSGTNDQVKKPKKEKKKMIQVSATGQQDGEVASLDEAYRTSKIVDGNVAVKEALVESVFEGSVQDNAVSTDQADNGVVDNEKVDSDDDAHVNYQSTLNPPLRTKSEKAKKGPSTIEVNSCDNNGSDPPNSDQGWSEPADKPLAKAGGDSNDAESVLSWKERPGSAAEHKTQCAFSFSNSVMFDLDVD